MARPSRSTIAASYNGDGNFLAASGTPLSQYVNTNLSGSPKLPSGGYNLSNANLVGGYVVNASLAGASLSASNLTGAVLLGRTSQAPTSAIAI